jgi:hypothetical protein
VARPNADPIIAGQQAATHQWWESHRHACEIYVSVFVDLEAERGEAAMAAACVAALSGLPRLPAPGRRWTAICCSGPRTSQDSFTVFTVRLVCGVGRAVPWAWPPQP